MTLGGLALAVGILVDDATVTIENINYHLEQGKEIETAIMDGARQIVVPATVSLLCICIVFVPMFGLGGVAGFLFRPLAEAVVFAMIGSYHPVAHAGADAGQLPAARPGAARPDAWRCRRASRRRPAQPAGRASSAASNTGSSRSAGRYRELLGHRARPCRWSFVDRLPGPWCCVSFGLVPFLGQNFFPTTDGGQIKLHVRAQTGTRIEETAQACATRSRGGRRQIIPPRELDSIVDNIGLPISGINMAYSNSGTIGVEDADILITLEARPRADRGLRADACASGCRGSSPARTFAFLPGRHRHADPEFRPARADRRADDRHAT